MRIEYNEYGKGYPYTIHGGWEDKVYCRLDDLKELKKEINKILREEKLKKDIDKPTKQCYNKDKIKEREERKMRLLMYGVFNKKTNEEVMVTNNKFVAEERLKELGKEDFIIRYKWQSF